MPVSPQEHKQQVQVILISQPKQKVELQNETSSAEKHQDNQYSVLQITNENSVPVLAFFENIENVKS